MAVINIEKDMPETCGMCDHRTICPAFAERWVDANDRYSLGVYCRLDDCPLKSIDGLIRKLDEEVYPFYPTNEIDEAFRNKITKVIKEYCGGEE